MTRTTARSMWHFPLVLLPLCVALSGFAQTIAQTTTVPRLISFSGIVNGANGKPLTSPVGITFSLYAQQQNGSPLWSEIQTVQPDAEGRYSVFLGAASSTGLPLDLFANGTARWLAVNPGVPGVADPARILLVGVPYALKAADADTLGGKPASAFVTTGSPTPATIVTASPGSAPVITPDVTPTGSGTTNFIPLWTSSSNLGNSAIYQLNNNIGIGTTAPVSPFTVSTPTGAVAAASYSYLADFLAFASGNSSGNSDYRSFNAEAKGTGTQSFAALTGFSTDANNALTSGTVTAETIAQGNVYVTGAGNTTTGYGFRATPILTSSGAMGAWQAFEARTPTISGSGGVASAYGLYVQPQKVTGVGAGFGVYETGASDINYLAGSLGIGTATPSANLEVNGTAKFDGAVTFAGAETATGNLTTSGAIISTAPTGTAPLQVASTTQVPNLNASFLGGQPASSFASLAAANAFTNQNYFYLGLEAIASGVPFAIEGVDENTSERTVGVYGITENTAGFGVEGVQTATSALGASLAIRSGVLGDSSSNPGVYGTSDNNYGGIFANNDSNVPTLVAESLGGADIADFLGSGSCFITGTGDLACSGSKSAVVPVDNATRKVALYAVEAPENWFEDFGYGQLSGGVTTIQLESVFAQTVNTDAQYHVFLTPNGDSKGLYVSNKTATSFEVHESAGGQSSIVFDYRIVARRKGYEAIRLADKTKEFDPARRPKLAQVR